VERLGQFDHNFVRFFFYFKSEFLFDHLVGLPELNGLPYRTETSARNLDKEQVSLVGVRDVLRIFNLHGLLEISIIVLTERDELKDCFESVRCIMGGLKANALVELAKRDIVILRSDRLLERVAQRLNLLIYKVVVVVATIYRYPDRFSS